MTSSAGLSQIVQKQNNLSECKRIILIILVKCVFILYFGIREIEEFW